MPGIFQTYKLILAGDTLYHCDLNPLQIAWHQQEREVSGIINRILNEEAPVCPGVCLDRYVYPSTTLNNFVFTVLNWGFFKLEINQL